MNEASSTSICNIVTDGSLALARPGSHGPLLVTWDINSNPVDLYPAPNEIGAVVLPAEEKSSAVFDVFLLEYIEFDLASFVARREISAR